MKRAATRKPNIIKMKKPKEDKAVLTITTDPPVADRLGDIEYDKMFSHYKDIVYNECFRPAFVRPLFISNDPRNGEAALFCRNLKTTIQDNYIRKRGAVTDAQKEAALIEFDLVWMKKSQYFELRLVDALMEMYGKYVDIRCIVNKPEVVVG